MSSTGWLRAHYRLRERKREREREREAAAAQTLVARTSVGTVQSAPQDEPLRAPPRRAGAFAFALARNDCFFSCKRRCNCFQRRRRRRRHMSSSASSPPSRWMDVCGWYASAIAFGQVREREGERGGEHRQRPRKRLRVVQTQLPLRKCLDE